MARGDERAKLEKQARKEMRHAQRQVDRSRDRLLMNGQEPALQEAYENAQRVYSAKWQALVALTMPEAV